MPRCRHRSRSCGRGRSHLAPRAPRWSAVRPRNTYWLYRPTLPVNVQSGSGRPARQQVRARRGRRGLGERGAGQQRGAGAATTEGRRPYAFIAKSFDDERLDGKTASGYAACRAWLVAADDRYWPGCASAERRSIPCDSSAPRLCRLVLCGRKPSASPGAKIQPRPVTTKYTRNKPEYRQQGETAQSMPVVRVNISMPFRRPTWRRSSRVKLKMRQKLGGAHIESANLWSSARGARTHYFLCRQRRTTRQGRASPDDREIAARNREKSMSALSRSDAMR